jgi:hypothetical protein
MNWFKTAQTQSLPASVLDGKSPAEAKKYLNNIIPHNQIKGFFSDESWEGVQPIWDIFNSFNLNWEMIDSGYSQDPKTGNLLSKRWNIRVSFYDKRGDIISVTGVVVASGAGSVENPLDRYDIVAYFL